MASSTWFLGAAGDLRPLPVPDPGIRITPTRFGGIRQGLSGARIVDVTGVRTGYEFSFTALEPAEWMYLEALHTRLIPGPLRLLDPLRRNRLSTEAAAVRVVGTRYGGVTLTAGENQRGTGFPTPTGFDHLVWWNRPADSELRFDTVRRTPVLAGETVTGSVYARTPAGSLAPVVLRLRNYALGGEVISQVSTQLQASDTWTRLAVADALPAGTALVEMSVTGLDANTLHIAAPQIENGTQPTTWEPGGGAPTVTVESLDHTSPRFPISTVSLTLMEA